MRVSIFNCCSNAIDMLKFSSESLIENAGYNALDYILVLWLPNDEVLDYSTYLMKKYSLNYGVKVHLIQYQTNNNVGYVPNIRGMMNLGFNYGFLINQYCGLANTDMYFGKNWLKNLVKYADKNYIVSSRVFTGNHSNEHIVEDFGFPEYGKFDFNKWDIFYDKYFEDRMCLEEERGHFLKSSGMPYLIYKDVWSKYGPWELTLENGTPDVNFCTRCHNGGIKFNMSYSSLVYHHSAAERTMKRPIGSEHMQNE